MDGSMNASLDSKARYVVLAYQTSVWHFVARAAQRDFDERKGQCASKDEELCKKRDETGRIPRDKRRRGRRRRRNGGTKEDHAGDYNINKQMSLEAGEFAIQSGTGGGREAESPPTNLEGLTRTLAPSLDLSSPSPACLSFTKFLLLAYCSSISSLSLLLSPPLLCGSRAFTYTKRDVHASTRRQRCVKACSRSSILKI
ncbi:hypothetical protein ALC53_08646 [Atta colombica]|uniref:Uncharacterized protein n=1 Tax=Atta colombica TaxID=520822 RepID=A0A151I222_9HYME|nr:hypothetical protein ALC53_08646 [Atta colombica]